MKTIILTPCVKLFLMTHAIPVRLRTNDSVRFYKAVAKLHGMKVERSFYGYVLS